MYFVAWILFKLRNNGMFSETGKPLCIEMSKNLSNAFQTAFHIQCNALCDFGIITTWWTGNVKERFSFIYNWSDNQRNYSTSWELEQRKSLSKWILFGKAEDVHGEWVFSSIISESWWLHGTGNNHYHEILGLEVALVPCESVQMFVSLSSLVCLRPAERFGSTNCLISDKRQIGFVVRFISAAEKTYDYEPFSCICRLFTVPYFSVRS